jgi:hypothetical protein
MDSPATEPRRPPIVRKGQRKPYTKATRKEIEQRLKAAAFFDSLEWATEDVDWFFQEVFGIESRQTARYRSHAHARAR